MWWSSLCVFHLPRHLLLNALAHLQPLKAFLLCATITMPLLPMHFTQRFKKCVFNSVKLPLPFFSALNFFLFVCDYIRMTAFYDLNCNKISLSAQYMTVWTLTYKIPSKRTNIPLFIKCHILNKEKTKLKNYLSFYCDKINSFNRGMKHFISIKFLITFSFFLQRNSTKAKRNS